ncbi:MAG: tetratricopeptide repeat protein, partial [Flavobacteriales bacterium]|nr:tetratricopeptide repeat protein [Flavobacteriales bacterium]
EYYAQALKLNEETANKKGIASTLLNIGTVYETKGDYPAALKYFLDALTLIQELQNKMGEAFVLNNLGIVYCKMKDFRTGIDHYNKACVVNREIGNKNALTRTLYNIAMTYLDQGEYEKAREKIEEALPLMEELGDEEGIASVLGSLGKIMIKAGDYESARENLDRAMEIHLRIEDYTGVAKLYLDYAQMNLQKKDFDTSLQKANEALRRYTELQGIEGVKVAHKILSATYEEMGNFELAYDHHVKFANFKDSLFSEDKSKEIGKLEAKYEFENAQADKKRIENERIAAETQAENRRNNLQHSGILIFLVMLSGGIMVLGNLAIPVRLVEGLIFLTFLLFFEFTLVLLDPYIEEYSSGAPAYKLMFNAAMAGLIFPLHSLFETQLKGRLVKRN